MVRRVAWVTAREARGLDEDEALGVAALERAGADVEVVCWDDAGVDWSTFDRVTPRSTWDYAQRLPEFLGWIDAVDAVSDLVNPPATIAWSLDKRYLAELEAAGVPITPTAFVLPGSTPELPAGEVVVKPAVGAGSHDAASYAADQREQAIAHVARLHDQGQVALVQPLLASVATEGEWALVFFGGELSHAANKRVDLPRAGQVEDLFAEERVVGHVPTTDQVEVARAAVGVVADRLGTPRYARVDLVRDDAGHCCVLEVELVEPSLFLTYADPAAADRFAAAVIR